MPDTKRLPHFPELDGIRGLAALAVFLHHFFNASTDLSGVICRIAALGFLGVQVFFVLSGFLISSLLFVDRRDPAMLRNFYWKRVLRIWPALIVYLIAAYTLTHADAVYVVLSLAFISNFEGLIGDRFEFGSTWTLAIEEQFYLIWPQIIRNCRVNTVFWLSWSIYLLSVGLRTALPLLRHDSIALAYTPYQCDGLALGAVLACQWFAVTHLDETAKKIIQFLNGRSALILWLVVLGLELDLYWRDLGGRNINTSLQMTLTTFLAYRVMVLVVLKRSQLVTWLQRKPLLFMGSISYGFYLYHGIVLERIVDVLGPLNMSLPLIVLARLVFSLGVAIAVSYVSLRFIELPVRKLRRRVLEVRTSVPDSGSPETPFTS